MTFNVKAVNDLSNKRPRIIADSETLEISNSFCTIHNFSNDIIDSIKSLLTYENKSVFFEILSVRRLLKSAKRKGSRKGVCAFRKRLQELEKKHVVCLLKDGKFPTGLIGFVIDHLKKLNYTFVLKDRRVASTHQKIIRWYNKPPIPRYYQQQMIDKSNTHCRGVFEAACGCGKTLIATYMIKAKAVDTLVIVPSRALLEQTERVFINAFGKKQVDILNSTTIKRKKKLKGLIKLATVQTLSSLNKSNLLANAVRDVDMLLVDEAHHTGAQSYLDLLPTFDHIYYRYGFTGTFVRNDDRALEMYGFLSEKLYCYLPKQATEEGFLTPINFFIKGIHGRAHPNYQKEYSLNYCGNNNFLHEILHIVEDIPQNEQILILVDRKETSGAIIHKFLKLHKFDNCYISGDNNKKDIADAIKLFNDEKIRILIGSSVIGEGVDIRSTQHLIMATGGKSLIKIVQSVGRCVRLHPGKSRSNVYDFCFTGTNFLEKHCASRIDIYNNQFTGEIKWLD